MNNNDDVAIRTKQKEANIINICSVTLLFASHIALREHKEYNLLQFQLKSNINVYSSVKQNMFYHNTNNIMSE